MLNFSIDGGGPSSSFPRASSRWFPYSTTADEPIIQIPEKRWQDFWREVEAIGVWNWKRSYESNLLDGTQWTLKLGHTGHTLHTSGNNAYPETEGHEFPLEHPPGGQFDRFLTALSHLIAIPKNKFYH
jgi:hypothetical protein